MRRLRKFAALLALCALAFSQVAVSAYACPMQVMSAAAGGDEVPDSSLLCERHCAYGDSSAGVQSETLPAPYLPPLPFPAAMADRHFVPSGRITTFDIHHPEPPPLERFGALRI